MSLNDLIKMASSINNPNQLVNILLGQMKKNNPQIANIIQSMMGKGISPKVALKQFAQDGKITSAQLTQLKQYYAMARKMGLKLNIPNNAFNEAEKIIKANENSSNNTNNKFNGF